MLASKLLQLHFLLFLPLNPLQVQLISPPFTESDVSPAGELQPPSSSSNNKTNFFFEQWLKVNSLKIKQKFNQHHCSDDN